jgi:hypothetical protein
MAIDLGDSILDEPYYLYLLVLVDGNCQIFYFRCFIFPPILVNIILLEGILEKIELLKQITKLSFHSLLYKENEKG